MIRNLCLVFMLGIMPLQSIWADEAEDMRWAIIERDLAQVKSLVEKGVSVNIKTDGLIFASMWGELEIVKYLVSKGADINAESKELGGVTTLMSALIGEHWEVAKYLVSKGANVNARFQKFNNATILMFASGTGNLEMVQYLIIKGADINAKDNNGKTALMEASLEGNLEIVKYLVSQGAYINAISTKDVYSMTALDFAEIAENYDIAEFLRKAGAKSLLNGTQFAMIRKEFRASKTDSKVATARSDIASTMKVIVVAVFANNINTKSPKAPKGESWGKWIIEIGELDTDRWAVFNNGIYLKDCNNKTQLIWINHKTGSMHFNPSKLNGDNEFCNTLKESYTLGENNGNKIVPLVSNDEVEF